MQRHRLLDSISEIHHEGPGTMPDLASTALALDPQLLLLAGIIWLAFTTEAATGFGGTVIAVTLGVRLYPIHVLLPLLVALNLILSSYIVWRHFEHISRRLLLTQILPVMGIGLAAGLVVFQRASNEALKTTFGVFVVAVAVRELRSVLSGGTARAQPLTPVTRTSGLLAAGIAHGLFACGGPLLVYVLGRSNLDKHSFRSTLSTVWLTLNLTLTAAYASTGRIDHTAVPILALLAPAVFLGIITGEWAHRRLDERRFRLAVLALLILAGLTILV
jgi:hypothetical protein